MSLILTIAAVWLTTSAVITGLWCLTISLFGTRDCNPPAQRAARAAQQRARHEFVSTHMSRYPVNS